MKILLIVAYFIPEIGSAAHIYFDLARAFAKRGHAVDVITSYPREFNLDEADRGREFPLEEEIEGVTIYRCKHPANRDNIFVRGLEHFYLPYYYFKKYHDIGKKYDVCLLYIPPLPLYYLAKKIKRYDGTPSVLNFQDFHPQELTDVGVLKNPVMIKILEHIEGEAYKHADYITVLSGGGIEYVRQRGADPEKVAHIFNSVSLSEFNDLVQRKDFKEREGIEDKFLISYAGILSPYQGIDNILDTAKALQDHDGIIFCIAGDGAEKRHLEVRIYVEEINNVRLLPLLPRAEYFNLVNSSDASFVSLDERMKAPCLPGKTINLMACSQPIIAMVAVESETADVIREAGCGIVVKPGDVEGIRSAILCLKEDASLREAMGSNGRRYLERYMNLEKNVALYEEIFCAIAGEEALARRPISSRSEDAPGVGHHGW
ncbi:glycosyltransferase family 4 protein [Methanoculleus sp.]|uniref:glycosyltransferase family 4 protein n=1 Tax=Methanoculleus sp. TaxID=90427 RepID=UPI00261052D1|nr:glycosyltransferase family 4 protein [Methanoculleus sp.]MDI6867736.1 glycosyltransferase family 4 protein [Methanoculleus sp.]